jgi:hypothetical protein
MLQLTERASIREDLEALTDTNIRLSDLDAELEHHHLNNEEYAELWLYGWALLEKRASGMVIEANDAYGYEAVEER